MTEQEQKFRTRGLSMLPSIPPRSEVTVIRTDAVHIRPGDVIGFPGVNAEMILHRVVRIRDDEQGIRFVARGDAQTQSEEIPARAAAYRAVRVKCGPFSYTTDGVVGSVVAYLAIRRGTVWSAAIRVARTSARIVSGLRAVFRAVT